MMLCKKIICLLWTSLLLCNAYPKTEVIHLKKGNLALPESQQPGPLFALGQNIVDKGDLAVYGYFDQNKGDNKNFIETIPCILYGITDYLSLYISSTIFLKHTLNNEPYKLGIQNIATELEYAFYDHTTRTFVDKATIVFGAAFPTRSTPIGPLLSQEQTSPDAPKNPSLNVGSPVFVLGATISRMEIHWYLWASPGVVIPTKGSNKTKPGNDYFLQCGIGRNIPTSSKWIVNGGLELDYILSDRDTVLGVRDANSGGQIMYLGPTLWVASKTITLQAGIAFPLYQHLYGKQNKNDYLAAVNFGIKI